ncbi:MAG: hypothetical protein P8Y16_07510, partial [Sulfurimonas sp.]
MEKSLEYYLNLEYPLECFAGEHEVGDAYLAEFIDFDIKAASEDYDEAIELAHEYLKAHITREYNAGRGLQNPNEGRRFMKHREALSAYKA